MRSIMTFLFALTLSISLIAQSTNICHRRLAVNVMPLSLSDITPRFRAGIEYLANNKLGYGLDLGFSGPNYNSIYNSNYALLEIRPEAKYFLSRRKFFSTYTAAELFFINLKSDFKNNYFESGSETVFYESATFHKQKFGVHAKVGIKLLALRRLELDVYMGPGIAMRNRYFTNVNIEHDETMKASVNSFLGPVVWKFEKKNELIAHFTFGFKLGIVLFYPPCMDAIE